MTDEKPTAQQMVQAMCNATDEAKTSDDLLPVGSYANYYGDAHKDSIDAENVEAFTHGTAIINLLCQEAILRVVYVAAETRDEADDDEKAYAQGVLDGGMLVAQLMAANADDLIRKMIESPAFERAFNDIVQNYK